MVHYATMKTRYAPLSGDFGFDFAVRRFGADAVEAALKGYGTYRSGPRKGTVKGFIVWNKCEKGGWFRTGRYDENYGPSGFVETKGVKWIAVVKEYRDAMDLLEGGNTGLPSGELSWSLEVDARREAEAKRLEGVAADRIVMLKRLITTNTKTIPRIEEAIAEENDDLARKEHLIELRDRIKIELADDKTELAELGSSKCPNTH